MAFNIFEIVTKYAEFQKMLQQTNADPRELLQNELRRRNYTPEQINNLIKQAEALKPLLKIH